MSPPAAKKEPPRFERWWIMALLAIWLVIGFVPKLDCNPGTFGDMFGMVNSLFSGLAFLGLIHTIRLQMHEIGLQRDELELTRSELERSADAQTESAKVLALQVVITAISARISTALQRRETAMNNQREWSKLKPQNNGVVRVGAPLEERPISIAIGEAEQAAKSLTEEIDQLSKRLEEYDNLLTAKLEGLQTV
jgi:hypothetical protein